MDIRFEQPAAPPVEIQLASKAVRTLGALEMFDVLAEVGATVLARGTITLHRNEEGAEG